MEFKYCFGHFTDGELNELIKALLLAFEGSLCDKAKMSIRSCKECKYANACGFLTDAIMIINDEKNRRSDLYD